MNRKEALLALQQEQENFDPEIAHEKADQILCNLLVELGYGDIVIEYAKVQKWYA